MTRVRQRSRGLYRLGTGVAPSGGWGVAILVDEAIVAVARPAVGAPGQRHLLRRAARVRGAAAASRTTRSRATTTTCTTELRLEAIALGAQAVGVQGAGRCGSARQGCVGGSATPRTRAAARKLDLLARLRRAERCSQAWRSPVGASGTARGRSSSPRSTAARRAAEVLVGDVRVLERGPTRRTRCSRPGRPAEHREVGVAQHVRRRGPPGRGRGSAVRRISRTTSATIVLGRRRAGRARSRRAPR